VEIESGKVDGKDASYNTNPDTNSISTVIAAFDKKIKSIRFLLSEKDWRTRIKPPICRISRLLLLFCAEGY